MGAAASLPKASGQSDWSSDFSNSYFVRLLEGAKRLFKPHLFRKAPELIGSSVTGRCILIRHDVDVSVSRAVLMAELECMHEISSCYFIMTTSPMYNLGSHVAELRKIAALGHEVGLHFDLPQSYRGNSSSNSSPDLLPGTLDGLIEVECAKIEQVLGMRVDSISFHRPPPSCLRGPLHVCGRVNAYAAPLMDWYLSDSKGRWRKGEPLPMLETPSKPLLQLLIHPIWWDEQHRAPEDRLEDFYREETRNLTAQDAAAWDSRLRETLPGVQRRGSPA